jgi:putative DNA primase/helicase
MTRQQNNQDGPLNENEVMTLYNDAKNYINIFTDGDYKTIKYFYHQEKNNIKCVSADSLGLFYIYNKPKALWCEGNIHNINKYYMEKTSHAINEKYYILIELSNNDNISLKNIELITLLIKTYEKTKKKILKCSYVSSLKSLFFSFFKDELFIEKLNKKKNLLSLKDGCVIDLKNGECRRRKQDDYFTIELKISYDDYMKADTHIWDEFFEKIFVKEDKRKLITDYDLIDYMKYYLGYCLTGETSLRSVLCFYGEGANGKSLLLDMMMKLLNTNNKNDKFYSVFDKNTFLDIKKSTCDDIYYSKFSRIAICDEFNENDEINTSIIKKISSGDEISSRAVYKSKISFSPIFKSILVSNHMMKFPSDDVAIFDRLLPVHFKRRFVPKNEINDKHLLNGYEMIRDKNIIDNLEKNLSGLLKLLVDGSIEYYKVGNTKTKPDAILSFAKDYKEDCQSEPFYNWFNDNIIITGDETDNIDLSEMMTSYNLYNRNPKYSLNRPNGFSKKLKSLNISTKRSSKTINGKRPTIVYGIKYKQEEEPEDLDFITDTEEEEPKRKSKNKMLSDLGL